MKERFSMKGTIAIIFLLVSFAFSACTPAAPSDQTPEFLNDISLLRRGQPPLDGLAALKGCLSFLQRRPQFWPVSIHFKRAGHFTAGFLAQSF